MVVDRGRGGVAARAVLAAVAAALAGCGDPARETPDEASSPQGEAPRGEGGGRRRAGAPALETTSEPSESAELGALAGTILFRGKVPERFPLGAAERAECQHHPEVDQRANQVVVADGRLAGAFVTISSGLDPARIPPAPEGAVTIDQRGCMYVPRVVALRAGQRLVVLNSDPTTHNVNLAARRNRAANRSMGAGQAGLEFVLAERELPVPLKCDIHPWMGAAVFVEEHPWFAISDERGAFRIADVPPGTYEVQAVHEVLGSTSGRLEVAAGRTTVFSLTLAR